mmetsp:Transcript_19600/g.46585  ORF Transcript_19600/g.46585 Transcript_19600/m.46585 type:complete len:436 (+) Transcript_19600:210-1517(+)
MPVNTSVLVEKLSDVVNHGEEETFLRQMQEGVIAEEDAASEKSVLREGEGEDTQLKNKSLLGKIKRSLFRSGSRKSITHSKKEEEEIKALVAACRSPCAAPEGGWANQNPEHAKRGRSVLSQLVRQLGSSLLRGQNIMNVSVPVACCQPRSALQVGADAACLAHVFLSQAARATDPLLRLQYVMAGAVGALSLTADAFLKPLNPLLGETLQLDFEDGSKFYMEQTSHHPPVLSFLHDGPGGVWRVGGHQQGSVAFGLNKLFFTSIGAYSVWFPDGTCIKYDFPVDRVLNVFWGCMVHEVVGEQRFEDAKHSLRGKLLFDNPRGLKGVPSDWFEGQIERYDPDNPEAEGQVVSRVRGSWCGFCDIDGQRLWSLPRDRPMRHTRPAVTLPSDSHNRPDLQSLAVGDVKTAQAEKLALEGVQRAEAQLRQKQGAPRAA